MNKTEQSKKRVLKALEASLGIVTTACKEAQVGRTTFYGWLESDASFAAAVQDIEEVALDYAESQLFKQMKGGSASAIIFFLKTKGRRRGYVEHVAQEDGKTLLGTW